MILTVCREGRNCKWVRSRSIEVQQGVPGVGASPSGADAERGAVVPGAGHLAPAFVLVAGKPAAGASRSNLRAPSSACARRMLQLKKALAEEDAGSGFFEGCLRKGRGSAPEPLPALAKRHLGSHPGTDADARQPWYRADVPAGRRSAAPDSTVFSNPATPAKKKWKCATPSSRSSLNIAAATVTGGSRRTPPPRHGGQP